MFLGALRGRKEGVRSCGAGVIGGCEPTDVVPETELGHSEEQRVLFTSEPSAHPSDASHYFIFLREGL